MPLNTVARLDEDMDLGCDAEGETDNGMYIYYYVYHSNSVIYSDYIIPQGSDTMEIYGDNTIYNIPAPVNHLSNKDEESEYESDSDTSIYQLDKGTLDSRIDLTSKAQKTFSNIKGQGKSLAF